MLRVCSQVQVFPPLFCATFPLNNDNMVTFYITEKGIYTCLVPQPFEIKKNIYCVCFKTISHHSGHSQHFIWKRIETISQHKHDKLLCFKLSIKVKLLI